MAPRRKPAPEVQDQPQEATPETEALTPAPAKPEDGAAAPETPGQLAALPSQREATDTALAQAGVGAMAPAGGVASLEAVERLLREREEEFRLKLRDYNDARQIEPVVSMKNPYFRLYGVNVLGMANGAYKVRIVFTPQATISAMSGTADVVVFVTVDGDDFEIVGHALPGDEQAVEQAAARPASAELQAVERLLGEREEAFEAALDSYLWDNWADRGSSWPNVRHYRLVGYEVLARRSDTYEVRVTFVKTMKRPQGSETSGELIVSLRLASDDFEIVGHRSLSASERRGQAAARSGSNEFEAVERLLRERAAEFLVALQAYMPNAPINVGGEFFRIARLWETEVLGRQGDDYRVRVVFDSSAPGNLTATGTAGGIARVAIVLVKADGGSLEVTGHEFMR